MSKPEQLFQCKMRRVDVPYHTTGWIPERAAKVGVKVQLMPEGKFWEVLSVGVEQPAEYLKEREKVNRRGLPSLERGWRDE